ncbi:hypothetical protein CAPTEDRAFT_221438 [Capitella teleta]|uniref:Ig-like domain-containing protein n=1 Tax=Capitella teleta TaxID=283909 RepID=R7TU64_CAPTE|nr:hypothetical protein CAPTEDRAFT_221438 [Capitella teleta]|eukprot:ELT97448.1 hypothetical protein CAPTEDRAFT_221438 [Capitella teleta]
MERLRLLVLSVMLAASSSAQQITTKPENQVVRVGDLVQFDCGVTGFSSGNSFQWLSRNIRNYDSFLAGESIFEVPARASGEPSDPNRYDIEGTYNLQIKKVTLQDAGWYGCRVRTTTHFATLILIEEPILKDGFMFANGLTTLVTCESTFASPSDQAMEADQLPKISFYLGEKKMNGVKSMFSSNDDGTQKIKGAANYSANYLDHGKHFECRVTIDSPSFMVKAEQTFSISFQPTNITIFPDKQNPDQPNDMYNIGDKIRCGAEGNPEPKVSWVVVSSPGPRLVRNHTLEILHDMVGYNLWKCQATNGIGAAQVKEFEFTVEAGAAITPAPAKGGTKPWVIAVAVIVVLLVVAGVNFVFLKTSMWIPQVYNMSCEVTMKTGWNLFTQHLGYKRSCSV